MGYQALLFCPDEKLARVVSQVFTDLDFAVEPVHEPFAAVKELMARRYDAIVVDCENEQNASLLFKSARNSSSNQTSLAIALVEGQAGVAKAYRIGANLVLTKPINVEQAKGTLRVARGLLRKNLDAAGAAAPSAAAPAVPPKKIAPASSNASFQPVSRSAAVVAPPASPELPEFEAPLSATLPAEISTTLPATEASAKVEERHAVVPAPTAQIPITIADEPSIVLRQPAAPAAIKHDGINNEVARVAPASAPTQNPASAFMSAPFMSAPGSAAAAAPAKEVTAPPAKGNAAIESESAKISHGHASSDAVLIPKFNLASITDAPSFAALGEEEADGSGRNKPILIAAAVILALAGIGYFGYGKLGKSSAEPAPQPATATQVSTQPSPALAPMSSPVTGPSTTTPDRAGSASPALASKPVTTVPLNKPVASEGSAPVIRIGASPEPATNVPSPPPIQVKTSTSGAKTQAQSEEAAVAVPSPLAVTSVNDTHLTGLMAASPSLPKSPLASIRISQGVSQGLLIKRVQPKYPQAALAVHAQGAVQIEATINKEGNVVNPKVLSGDPVLARAALEAVRQWRYKPYYLDGDPVEIQTQITVNFKAN